jgi:hypothetical protein
MGLKVEHKSSDNRRGSCASRANVVLLGLLAIGGYCLVTEHWAHVVPFLPWLFLLACPLMHVFMHGGYGGHSGERMTLAIQPTRTEPAASALNHNEAKTTVPSYGLRSLVIIKSAVFILLRTASSSSDEAGLALLGRLQRVSGCVVH